MMTTEQQTPILTFTEAARTRIKEFLDRQGSANAALRIAIAGRSSSGFRYALNIADLSDRPEGDIEVEGGGFPVLVDGASVEDLRGASVDFVETAAGGGIQIDNPNPVWRNPVEQQVQEVLDT